MKLWKILFILCFTSLLFAENQKKIIYLTPDLSIPFWQIISKGVEESAKKLNYDFSVYSAGNSAKQELINTMKAIKSKPSAIVISPTNSSNCVTVLNLINKAEIPVVIADVGTDSGEYLSYISSDNYHGAYKLGHALTSFMKKMKIENSSVGIIAIPQKRSNGKLRTTGFMKALNEVGIKSADMRQQIDFSFDETYKYTKDLISLNPNMKVLWLQGSDKYGGALKAIEESKKEIYLITFDAEPEFLELIPKNIIVAAGMQQPFLMGEKAVQILDSHLKGKKVDSHIELPILAVTKENIERKLPLIKRNVLGIINETK
ncbi:substrate-binding domain-containing protein [Halarcobacter bivalviorum]|uniref:ABC transporter, periplasmic substrate-binding protein n=1 Tax=Halarcobacter bivalviorum TaxID=663364 RepID=A0AB33GCN1_9BACT|nr:substrate-binding domain-containing protein [Halarcobacter bivalviorum]AXH11067.1 ABC transporter, periplasmic substrate-binding protein [Halarcobacter bivalviorum]